MKNNFLLKIDKAYSKFVEKKLYHKRFTNNDMIPLIENLKVNSNLKVKLAGNSIENRQIFLLEYGEGKTNVLLWSQMHGDEPTATMAMFDIFNFLNGEDEFNEFREIINKNLKLVFVPMLNPDGAERIIRHNAIGIDLNRDAKELQSPESKILLKLVEDYKPNFGFNLHDQDFKWSVGNNNKLAAMSLLAPVYDYDKSINASRSNAIKLVADLRNEFEKYLPGQIARYKDDYEPRSFGDTIAGMNVSTILIESGVDPNDFNKMHYRKLNFLMLLYAFNRIIDKSYEEKSIEEYFEIPTNGKFMYDLLLRNAKVKSNEKEFLVDIAINREEFYEKGGRFPFHISNIIDIGDLNNFYGIEEYDCTGLELKTGKMSNIIYNSLADIKESDIKDNLISGVQFLKVKESLTKKKSSNLPINLIEVNSDFIPSLNTNTSANFNLYKNDKIVKHIINGWLCNPNEIEKVKNGLIF